MFRFVTTVCAAAALAACSSADNEVDADGDGTVSTAEAKAAASKVRPLQPGEYKMNMELVDLTDPTMSADEITEAKKFFSSMGGMAPARCLTEEEANEGMAGIAQGLQDGNCTVESMTADESGMQGEMTCKAENGEAKVSLDTTSTGTESQMTMRVVEPTEDGKEKSTTMKIGMTRLGDCSKEG